VKKASKLLCKIMKKKSFDKSKFFGRLSVQLVSEKLREKKKKRGG